MDTPCVLSCNRSLLSVLMLRGLWPELIDAAQDLCEQRSRHRHLCQLEHHVAAVADDSGTDLDQLLAQRGERPMLDLLG